MLDMLEKAYGFVAFGASKQKNGVNIHGHIGRMISKDYGLEHIDFYIDPTATVTLKLVNCDNSETMSRLAASICKIVNFRKKTSEEFKNIIPPELSGRTHNVQRRVQQRI